jgi:hypothetical protein
MFGPLRADQQDTVRLSDNSVHFDNQSQMGIGLWQNMDSDDRGELLRHTYLLMKIIIKKIDIVNYVFIFVNLR